MKLIKLNTNYYVIVDDSEIKEGDYYLFTWGGEQEIQRFFKEQHADRENHKHLYDTACKKITHSTQPLEDGTTIHGIEHKRWVHIKYIGLSEVKELFSEINVEKKYTEEDLGLFLEYVRDNYTGVGAPHLVHNKGGQRKTKAIVQDYIQSLQPKTEWEVEWVDGKLELKC